MWQFIWRLYSPIDEFWRYLFHVAKIHGITLTDVGEIVKIAGAFLALISAVVLYRTNNRIKASELLISLEIEYKEHIKVVTEIEFVKIYDSKYKPYLEKDPKDLKPEDIEIGIQLESAIRYFYLCSKIGKLGVTNGHIQFMSAYYLRVLVYEVKKEASWKARLNPCNEEKYKRPELRNYMYKYWHGVYFWAPHARRPWPARIFIYIRQIPFRLRFWFKTFHD
jgi:hypothetical protein